MEIQECSLPGFYCSRIFGLAPYLIRRNSNQHRIIEIRQSRWLRIYSICCNAIIASLSIRYLFIDPKSKAPIRMRSEPSKFVTRFEVFIIVSAVVCGAVTGLVAWKSTRKINSNLRKIDDELSMFDDDLKKDKRRNFVMVAVVFVILTVMVALDIVFKWRSAANFRAKLRDANVRIDMESYLPFYVQYYVLMALHTQLAQTVLGIQRRYYRLNLAIKHLFPLKFMVSGHLKVTSIDSPSEKQTSSMKTKENISLSISNVNEIKRPTARLIASLQSIQTENSEASIFDVSKCSMDSSITTFLNQLTCCHAILGQTVATISKAFGMTMLLMLMSCVLTLVATEYFLFVELITELDIFATCMLLLWCCFHLLRLLLIIEPCHMASSEANQTITIVCEVLRNCKDSSIEAILQGFWRQLLADRNHYFTAFGLCTIDRQILTSICAAITTYLVILIQFV